MDLLRGVWGAEGERKGKAKRFIVTGNSFKLQSCSCCRNQLHLTVCLILYRDKTLVVVMETRTFLGNSLLTADVSQDLLVNHEFSSLFAGLRWKTEVN